MSRRCWEHPGRDAAELRDETPLELTGELNDELAAHLRFRPRHYGLLALLFLLVIAIATLGFQSNRRVNQDTEALNSQLQLVSGNMVSLERQILTHAITIERWIDGTATEDDLILSRALVERQRTILADNALRNPELQPQMTELNRTLDRVTSLVAQGRPAPGSDGDTTLEAATDEMVLGAKQLFDTVEAANFGFVHALEDGLRNSRRTELIVATLIILLMLLLLASMRTMLLTNYRAARTSLQWEQNRYALARAEQEKAEQQLRQAQKLESVGQLAAGVAHEINTPMQYIGDNTHFLKATVTRLLDLGESARKATAAGATDDDRAALAAKVESSTLSMLAERAPQAADDALEGVESVSRIVKALKRFSHPGSEEFEPVDVNDAIRTAMTVSRNEWRYAATIETDLSEELPAVDARLGSLNQVWLIMIVNAAHAIAERHGDDLGTIRIGTRTVDGGDAVEISIADNGSGIEPNHLNRIYDQFFTTKEVGRGTGQGLAIAHQVIVSEHHGSLEVESEKGAGTTFKVTLPTSQAAAPTPGDER